MLTRMTPEAASRPQASLRERRFATVVFVALVLLLAGVKWWMGWPPGAMILVALGIFHLLIPIHRYPLARLWMALALVLLAVGLQAVAADVNSPVASLGTSLVLFNASGGLVSPFLIRPARFEAMGQDLRSETSA